MDPRDIIGAKHGGIRLSRFLRRRTTQSLSGVPSLAAQTTWDHDGNPALTTSVAQIFGAVTRWQKLNDIVSFDDFNVLLLKATLGDPFLASSDKWTSHFPTTLQFCELFCKVGRCLSLLCYGHGLSAPSTARAAFGATRHLGRLRAGDLEKLTALSQNGTTRLSSSKLHHMSDSTWMSYVDKWTSHFPTTLQFCELFCKVGRCLSLLCYGHGLSAPSTARAAFGATWHTSSDSNSSHLRDPQRWTKKKKMSCWKRWCALNLENTWSIYGLGPECPLLIWSTHNQCGCFRSASHTWSAKRGGDLRCCWSAGDATFLLHLSWGLAPWWPASEEKRGPSQLRSPLTCRTGKMKLGDSASRKSAAASPAVGAWPPGLTSWRKLPMPRSPVVPMAPPGCSEQTLPTPIFQTVGPSRVPPGLMLGVLLPSPGRCGRCKPWHHLDGELPNPIWQPMLETCLPNPACLARLHLVSERGAHRLGARTQAVLPLGGTDKCSRGQTRRSTGETGMHPVPPGPSWTTEGARWSWAPQRPDKCGFSSLAMLRFRGVATTMPARLLSLAMLGLPLPAAPAGWPSSPNWLEGDLLLVWGVLGLCASF